MYRPRLGLSHVWIASPFMPLSCSRNRDRNERVRGAGKAKHSGGTPGVQHVLGVEVPEAPQIFDERERIRHRAWLTGGSSVGNDASLCESTDHAIRNTKPILVRIEPVRREE